MHAGLSTNTVGKYLVNTTAQGYLLSTSSIVFPALRPSCRAQLLQQYLSSISHFISYSCGVVALASAFPASAAFAYGCHEQQHGVMLYLFFGGRTKLYHMGLSQAINQEVGGCSMCCLAVSAVLLRSCRMHDPWMVGSRRGAGNEDCHWQFSYFK